MGVDPLADKYPGWNPYHYVHNNPIRLTDPDGMEAETIFEDENGNVLHETNDGIDETVVVANENVEDFKQAVSELPDYGIWSNQRTEEQNTINLFNSYAKKGQAMTTIQRSDGSEKIIDIGDAPVNTVHQVGVSATVAGGIGFTIGGGVTWDSKGEVGIYGMFGPAFGGDLNFNVEYSQSTGTYSGFGIKSLSGISIMNNVGVSILDFGGGGNAQTNGNFGTAYGTTYDTGSVGVSLGMPVGVTRTIESTAVIKLK